METSTSEKRHVEQMQLVAVYKVHRAAWRPGTVFISSLQAPEACKNDCSYQLFTTDDSLR